IKASELVGYLNDPYDDLVRGAIVVDQLEAYQRIFRAVLAANVDELVIGKVFLNFRLQCEQLIRQANFQRARAVCTRLHSIDLPANQGGCPGEPTPESGKANYVIFLDFSLGPGLAHGYRN